MIDVANKLLSSLALVSTLFVIAPAKADAVPSCTLTASPQRVHQNQTVTLTLRSNGDLLGGYIDFKEVPLPVGSLVIAPGDLGTYTPRGMVLSQTLGEFFCDTTYEVIEPEKPKLVGDVVSATTGLPLPGVSISAIPANQVTTSDANGAFTFNNVPPGAYTLTASLVGYTTETASGVAAPGTNPPIHIVMNPVLPDDQLRIVLTWGETPRDLDSHLFTTWDAGDAYHIYYSDKVGLNTNLDVDDTSSYGPETVTILDATPGRYTYAVYDYTNGTGGGTGQILASQAVVKVYKGNNQIEEFHPSANAGTHVSWYVFDAVISATGRVRIIPKNTYNDINLNNVSTFP